MTDDRARLVFGPGQEIEAWLAEADAVSGRLAFQFMQGIPAPPQGRARRSGKRSRLR